MTEHEFIQQSNAYRAKVFRYALQLTDLKEEAEELLQETLAKAWRYRDTYDPAHATFGTWFISVYHNVVKSWYEMRSNGKHDGDTVSFEQLAQSRDEDRQPELAYDPMYDSTISMEQALSALGGIHEEVIRLCFIGGLTFNEAASTLGLTKRKVRRILATALKRLRRLLNAA